MGICTTLWRSRIGSFNQKYLKTPKTLRKRKMKKSEGISRLKLLFTILSLFSSFYYAEFENPQNKFENPRKGEGSLKVQCVMDLENIVNS